MNDKGTAVLLITAKEKIVGDSYGHGLPYDLPIINPVWIEMEAVSAAFVADKAEMVIHSVGSPVVLTRELYDKFIEFGYLNEEIIAENHIAPVVTLGEYKVTGSEGEEISIPFDIATSIETSNMLISFDIETSDNIEISEVFYADDIKGIMVAKLLYPGDATITMTQTKMGADKTGTGTTMEIAITVEEIKRAPKLISVTADKETLRIGEEVTVTCTYEGSPENKDLIDLSYSASGRLSPKGVAVVEETETGLTSTITYIANEDGIANISYEQAEYNIEGVTEITVMGKIQAPIMGKPLFRSGAYIVNDEAEIKAPLTGPFDNPELFKAIITNIKNNIETIEDFKIEENYATAKIKFNEAGRTVVAITQVEMGPEKDKTGTTFQFNVNIVESGSEVIDKFTSLGYTIVDDVITVTATFIEEPTLEDFSINIGALVELTAPSVNGETIVSTYEVPEVETTTTFEVTASYDGIVKNVEIEIVKVIEPAVMEAIINEITDVITVIATFDKAPELADYVLTTGELVQVSAPTIIDNTIVSTYEVPTVTETTEYVVSATHLETTLETTVNIVYIEAVQTNVEATIEEGIISVVATFDKTPKVENYVLTVEGLTQISVPTLVNDTIVTTYEVPEVIETTELAFSSNYMSIPMETTLEIIYVEAIANAPVTTFADDILTVTVGFDKAPKLELFTIMAGDLVEATEPTIIDNTIVTTYTAVAIETPIDVEISVLYNGITLNDNFIISAIESEEVTP